MFLGDFLRFHDRGVRVSGDAAHLTPCNAADTIDLFPARAFFEVLAPSRDGLLSHEARIF
jgi:hypothetical protein